MIALLAGIALFYVPKSVFNLNALFSVENNAFLGDVLSLERNDK